MMISPSLFLLALSLLALLLAAETQAFVVLPPATFHSQSTNHQLSLSSSTTQNDNTDLTATILEGLVEAGGTADEWTQAAQWMANLLQVEYEEGEQILAVATRWKTWATSGKLARKYVTPILPNVSNLQESLEWLQQGPLALDLNVIQQYVTKHPAVYLMSPADSYRKAISSAPRQYRDPETFRSLILQDPTVLQCYYNCDNDCMSECGSCWTTFANRL